MRRFPSGWLDRLAARERRYFAIDGGAGAALLAQLAVVDERLRAAESPHHADLLLVVEPVTERMLAAVAESYRNVAPPRHVVVAGREGAGAVRIEEHLPVAVRVGEAATLGTAHEIARAVALAVRGMRVLRPADADMERTPEEVLIPLRTPEEREIATEDVVLSVGPVGAPTAGPVRLLLLMDGEQVLRAEVRAGYAARGLAERARGRPWAEGLALAGALDPLAPLAGRMAFAQAVEVLRGQVPPARALRLREAALRLERAASHLVWLVRFAELLGYGALVARARRLAAAGGAVVPPAEALVIGGWDAAAGGSAATIPAALPAEVARLARALRADRLFALRTRGVGVLAAERAREAGASGAVLAASVSSRGDAWARAIARGDAAADDLRAAAEILARLPAGPERTGLPETGAADGAAESQVEGPRGTLTLEMKADGSGAPAGVFWARPSAAHLALVPELVVGHTLPDALTAVASLDLSMAEADG